MKQNTMWKTVVLFVCIFYTNTNFVQTTYNSGIKTRVYTSEPITQVYHHHNQHEHHQHHAPTHEHYHHYSGGSGGINDNDFQTSITHQYGHNVNSYQPQQQQQQQQQHESSYYQQTPIQQTHYTQHHQYHHQQQPPLQQSQLQLQPIYERREYSQQKQQQQHQHQQQTAGNWHNSENSINEYYTGCPAGHTGQLPYAYDCRRFLNCWNGRGHIQTCSVGTVFNPESLECDRPDKVKCEAALGVLGVQSVTKSTATSTHGNLRQSTQTNYRAGRYNDIATDHVEVLCPPGVEGLQPHPSDCTRFLNCANGNVHIQQCGPGTAYSIPMQVCDFKNKVDCSGREGNDFAAAPRQDTQESAPHHTSHQHEDLPHTADILCLNGITGLFPYPFDYTKFIKCKNGNTAIQNCVPGTAFSISKGYCESLDEIQQTDHVMYIVSQVSYEYSQTLITCPPGTEGIHLYPFNAEKFIKCVKSQMLVVPCSTSQVFSVTRRTCLPINQVLKHERVRLLSELQTTNKYHVAEEHYSMNNMVYCAGGLTGTYPHPFDSTKYLKCVRGRLYSESCASGEAFSLSRKVCASKEEINMEDRVPAAKISYGQESRVSDMEITYGSIDGMTYLMCPPGLDGYFLHPFDCTKYIQCSQGVTVLESCLNGAVFSISRRECIPRDKVEAYDRVEYMTTTTNEFSSEANQYHRELGITCMPGTFGIYPHPHDCHKFMRCANGRISVENCPTGQVFSVRRSYCYNENEVESTDRSSYGRSHSTTQSRYAGSVNTHTNTVHQSGSYSPVSVSQTSLSSSQSSVINQPSTVVLHPPLPSAPNAAVIGEVNCPPGASGRLPHPYDCTKFLMCTNGVTHVQDCGPGTAWNKAMEVCDFKDNVDCSQGRAISSTSTGTITTSSFNPQIQIVCPAGVEGLYQHPYDWHKYLVCNHGQTTITDCAPGTVFSISRRACLVEANVVNTDRCNNGVYSTEYDYTYNQNYNNRQSTTNYGNNGVNTQWSHTGTQSQNAPTTRTQVTESRWTNMNVPRPQSSTYDQTATWQQTSKTQHLQNPSPTRPDGTRVWSGTAVHVDQRNPTHTVIYEEGSLAPNRNYNRQMFSTPLAPLAPLQPTTNSTTTTTVTVVYAQPVGSQEDSHEIFPNTPTNPTNIYNSQHASTSKRHNHTRHINVWTPAKPIDMPVDHLMPPHEHSVYTTAHVQMPITTHLMPPYQNPEHVPQYPSASLPESAPPPRPVTHLMSPYDSGQQPLPESDFQINTIPGRTSYNPNTFDQLPSGSSKHNVNDDTNLYGGLQPPLLNSQTTTTDNSFLGPYEQATQVPPPPANTLPTNRISGYPQLSNATIQTFPKQPHYSPPYSEVTHSRNVSWVGRKVPQHSAIKPSYKDPLNSENTNVKITSTPPPQYYGLSPPPHANSELDDTDSTPEAQDQEVVMKAALKLLLRPYLDSETIVDDEVAEKAQSHIMSLVSNSDREDDTTTHKPPPSNKNTLDASITPPEDVELILAGEQHSLVGVTTTNSGTHETSTDYNLRQTLLQSERSSAKLNQFTHDHNKNWHRHHSHEPHHSKFEHSREFHEKHPYLPNPFEVATNPSSTTNPSSSRTVATTTTTGSYDFDLRVGGRCQFDCGNGRCVEQHQVCDGVNNCENRKDEQQCEHLGYELRLTGGPSSNMGRVEVKILGKWGYVCDDKFGLKDADVVCRELGFKMGAMEVRGNSYYPPQDVNIYFAMDEVECKGNETSLKDCDFKGWGVNNCGPDEVVGVVCRVPKLKCPDNYWLCTTSKECIPTAFLCDLTPDCEDGSDESEQVCNAPIKYRLEGGRSSNEGRLEVFYRGEWGTVCDDDFGLKEAQVVCNSFGLYGKAEIAKNIYGPGSGPIWLDQVSCLGNETKIDECNHWSWGENNCNHTEDVGLKCTAGPKPETFRVYNPPVSQGHKDTDSSSLEMQQSELDDLGLYQGLWQRSSKAVQTQKKCGHFKSNLFDEYEHPEERVVNGSIAKRGRHPWQATIRTRGRGGISSHWCGAVIISKKLILTAAHCLAGYPKGSYFVRMGDHYANIAESSEIDSNIENWYIHEKFRDQKHMNNDIALILLKTPVRFNDYIQPICLPEKGATLETNRMCTISGWGSIKSGTSTPSNILRSAQVPILADEVCSRKNVYANAMTEGMFCAGFLDESVDACDGDSGGPLVCSDEDGETLYGIISWGQHCGYANHPGVYVRVEKYIDWIYDKINLMIQQGKL